ncbi:MAG: hypothetical protein V7749_12035 [Cocleimonas sp.]|jgi:hypothetical protein
MKKIMIQFHATLEELVEYMNSVGSDFDLYTTMMILRPFTLKEIDGELSVNDIKHNGDVRIIFTKERPNINASSPNKFYDLNPGTVDLDIGQLTSESLKESALAFMSDDKDKMAVANKLASRLKKITKAGAIAVNPDNGAEANARSHRYTEGAKAMYADGVKILPVAGNCFFKLAD